MSSYKSDVVMACRQAKFHIKNFKNISENETRKFIWSMERLKTRNCKSRDMIYIAMHYKNYDAFKVILEKIDDSVYNETRHMIFTVLACGTDEMIKLMITMNTSMVCIDHLFELLMHQNYEMAKWLLKFNETSINKFDINTAHDFLSGMNPRWMYISLFDVLLSKIQSLPDIDQKFQHIYCIGHHLMNTFIINAFSKHQVICHYRNQRVRPTIDAADMLQFLLDYGYNVHRIPSFRKPGHKSVFEVLYWHSIKKGINYEKRFNDLEKQWAQEISISTKSIKSKP